MLLGIRGSGETVREALAYLNADENVFAKEVSEDV